MPDANITKSALAGSMKKLMRTKDFAKISVVDICDGCGMNRKSFYYHFKDKYDLMNWVFYTDFVSMMVNKQHETGWDLIISVCWLFYNDQNFYRTALHTEGQNSFTEYFHESMVPIVGYVFGSDEDDDDEENDFKMFSNLFCDSFLSAVIFWLEDGCRYSPEEFVDKLKAMVKKIAEAE